MARTKDEPNCDTVLLQGGGALGAYEWGVWEALEEKGMDFSLVAGVSIGALNAAIIASRGREASTYLGRFWEEAADPFSDSPLLESPIRQEMAAAKSLLFGNPSMFVPLWMKAPFSTLEPDGALAFYDPSPLEALIKKHIDFRAIRTSRRKLVVSAVDVESGELAFFDNRTTTIVPKHIMASGALPPAFPPVEIGGRLYWDGGIVSNAPIRRILRSLPSDGLRRLLFVELFPRHHPVPRNVKDVFEILKDFAYMTRVDIEGDRHHDAEEVQSLIGKILADAGPLTRKVRDWPEFKGLAEKYAHEVKLYKITHSVDAEDDATRDADFSPTSLKKRRGQGRKAALEAISRWEKDPHFRPFACLSAVR